MAADRLIVIGASAGGIPALVRLFRDLPERWSAAVAVALHLAPNSSGNLASVLGRGAALPVAFATDGEQIRSARIYVAPPDRHLVVSDGALRVSVGPKSSRHRPAIDVLFRSAARAWGPRVIGVVLSGYLDDGTLGLAEIRRAGGLAVVQDPADAEYPSMPASALEGAGADHRVSISEMAALLEQLAALPTEDRPMDDDKRQMHASKSAANAPVPSVFGCPDCGGVLWEERAGDLVRFECRVGHGFSPAELMQVHEDAFEDALWAALRNLEEQSELARRLAERSRGRGLELSARSFEERAKVASERAAVVRVALDGSLQKTSKSFFTGDDPAGSDEKARR